MINDKLRKSTWRWDKTNMFCEVEFPLFTKPSETGYDKYMKLVYLPEWIVLGDAGKNVTNMK